MPSQLEMFGDDNRAALSVAGGCYAPNDRLQTPNWVWSALGPFDLDPCAGENTVIANVNWWDGRGECGLSRQWFGLAYCNPPFSQKETWIQKVIEHGNAILILPEPFLLLPALDFLLEFDSFVESIR